MVQTGLVPLPHGITLSVRSAGQPGRPVLVFLHGFPEAAFVWDGLLAHFAALGYRCLAPNLRGFERSSAPADPALYRPKLLAQDIAALVALEGGHLAALVAHDWGGAVAWGLANQRPDLMDRLVILNSPHAGTFLRELQTSPEQQAASAYMNFLVRPDAEALLAENDYQRLWKLFANMGAVDGPRPWLTEAVKARYRDAWQDPPGSPLGTGLRGGCNYYRASPLRPPRPEDPAAAAVTLPDALLSVDLPTLVLWGLGDIALRPELLNGLDRHVPHLTVKTRDDATHWLVHEHPDWVMQEIAAFLAS